MKKTTVIYLSYIAFILALICGIQETYAFAGVLFLISCGLIGLIFVSSNHPYHLSSKDLGLWLLLLVLVGFFKNSFITISNQLYVIAFLTTIYNTLFIYALRAVSKGTKAFVTKTILGSLTLAIILLAIVDGIILYQLQSTSFASIGYLYLLFLNWFAFVGSYLTNFLSQLAKTLILS